MALRTELMHCPVSMSFWISPWCKTGGMEMKLIETALAATTIRGQSTASGNRAECRTAVSAIPPQECTPR